VAHLLGAALRPPPFSLDRSSISSTTASGNVRDGIFVAGAGVKVTKTTVAGNGLTGINVVGDSASLTSVTATGNKDSGLAIDGDFAKIASSTVQGNGGYYGIRVDGNGASLTRNVANANGFGSLGGYEDGLGQGIRVNGSNPVGVNSARGNDDPTECLPITLC
jgi:parallel beta helix pectate lyase-like protein